MIDTVNLLPPGFGPRADPLLFGVSEGLLRLFPLPTADQPAVLANEPAPDTRIDPAAEQGPSVVEA